MKLRLLSICAFVFGVSLMVGVQASGTCAECAWRYQSCISAGQPESVCAAMQDACLEYECCGTYLC